MSITLLDNTKYLKPMKKEPRCGACNGLSCKGCFWEWIGNVKDVCVDCGKSFPVPILNFKVRGNYCVECNRKAEISGREWVRKQNIKEKELARERQLAAKKLNKKRLSPTLS